MLVCVCVQCWGNPGYGSLGLMSSAASVKLPHVCQKMADCTAEGTELQRGRAASHSCWLTEFLLKRLKRSKSLELQLMMAVPNVKDGVRLRKTQLSTDPPSLFL